MTNDLISREALMDEISAALLNARFTSVRAREQHEEKIQWALDLVGEAPTVDAAPVVHAEWDHWGGDEWQCTNCAEFVHTEGSWERPRQKYCPYCGAKMDAGDDTNAKPD